MACTLAFSLSQRARQLRQAAMKFLPYCRGSLNVLNLCRKLSEELNTKEARRSASASPSESEPASGSGAESPNCRPTKLPRPATRTKRRRDRHSSSTSRSRCSSSRQRSRRPAQRTHRDKSKRQRSRSPHTSRASRSWANRMSNSEEEVMDYVRAVNFSDSEAEDQHTSKLLEVSEKTRAFLAEKCTWSVRNGDRMQLHSLTP